MNATGAGCVGSGLGSVGAGCSTGLTVVGGGGGGGGRVVVVVVVDVVVVGSGGRTISNVKVVPDVVSVTTIVTVVPHGTPVSTSTVDHSPCRSARVVTSPNGDVIVTFSFGAAVP